MEPFEPTYKKRRYLSISTLLEFSRCPRKYFYSKCGLQATEEPLAPIYGSAMHAAVPVALETADLTLSMKAFMSVWTEVEEKLDSTGDSDPKRNRVTAERSLKHFTHTHQGSRSLYKLLPAPAGALQSDDKTSPYEVPWAIDIGLSVPLVGRFDAFCQHRDTAETYVFELKTTSRMNTQFFEAHEMNPQNTTYSLVARTLIERDVAGVMLEGMLVDAKKVDNMTQPIPIQPHHLEDVLQWLRATGQRLLDMEQQAEQVGFDPANAFYKDFSGCTPYPLFYMPGYRCEFADLCRVPDWHQLVPLYRIAPDFDFLKLERLGIDPDATRKVSTSTTAHTALTTHATDGA